MDYQLPTRERNSQKISFIPRTPTFGFIAADGGAESPMYAKRVNSSTSVGSEKYVSPFPHQVLHLSFERDVAVSGEEHIS
jgi:hypothetical protein